tara:strand:+ start:2104 stop:2811 length:708 start_codon:yes stop_codon:yes gene_type:complete
MSDLHLDKKRPEVIKFFINYMNHVPSSTKAIYILGDLVEYWVGDDDPADGLKDVFQIISTKSKEINIYFMHGNRDFLISENFCKKHGMKLLQDPTLINLYNKKILLMHGDILCTDDKQYQEYRALVRSHEWQSEMLIKTLSERLMIAQQLREKSLEATEKKNEYIMDVNNEAVIEIIKEYDADILIHGHTHRPNIHKLQINQKDIKRIVLGDWYDRSFILEFSKDKITIDKQSLS